MGRPNFVIEVFFFCPYLINAFFWLVSGYNFFTLCKVICMMFALILLIGYYCVWHDCNSCGVYVIYLCWGQMFFATSVLHVHLMQWEDGSLVEGAVSRCNDVWESIDPDRVSLFVSYCNMSSGEYKYDMKYHICCSN